MGLVQQSSFGDLVVSSISRYSIGVMLYFHSTSSFWDPKLAFLVLRSFPWVLYYWTHSFLVRFLRFRLFLPFFSYVCLNLSSFLSHHRHHGLFLFFHCSHDHDRRHHHCHQDHHLLLFLDHLHARTLVSLISSLHNRQVEWRLVVHWLFST